MFDLCLPTFPHNERLTSVWTECTVVNQSHLLPSLRTPYASLSASVCNNTFVFNMKVYELIDGVAMGSSLGPVLANIWMAHLEEQHLLIEESVPLPLHYMRYADDTFCVFKSLEDTYSFLEFINSVDPSTKFDI